MRKLSILFSLVVFSFFSCQKDDDPEAVLNRVNISIKNNPVEEYPGEGYYKVKTVIDGDTFYLENKKSIIKVRLIGINTPELHPVEFFGDQARIFTYNLVNNRYVRLEYDVEHHDKYKRTLAYAYLSDGTFINNEIIKNGYARQLTIPPNVKFEKLFYESLQYAKKHKLGMWHYN
ncbi:nuclease [Ornithobacterium rhinotracheale]|uniref:thermonuclease family protein n=1 Tax=Ornithobacterium rhinotracheale TaxID=28251 RepID=UPI00129C5895|nr:thermonuclease family protein [Ornithobacterium rhinotracheale]MRJ11472.1 nuclease [Ornithobacterium rhinotracheale]